MPQMLPKRWVEKASKIFRTQKFQVIHSYLEQGMAVLDIGVWSKFPESNPSENWLEKQKIGKGSLIAVGLESMQSFVKKYPHVICVQANGCALPFVNSSVDIAVSNAVLEHVPEILQSDFVREISRVSRVYSVLTVPDRFCPIEVHSRIFFLHWFPGWRNLFEFIGEVYWSLQENLATIFTKRTLLNLLNSSSKNGSWKVKRLTLCEVPISLIAKFTPSK